MKRGDIYRVDWEPSGAGEPAFHRPAVVLSNDDANAYLPHLVVAPITSNTKKLYPFDVLLPVGCCGLEARSKVQLNYVRGLNRNRLTRYLGSIPQDVMFELNASLRVHLGL
ncbi:MAG: type II toxin-antitoxin system PemK/MazF family toxin [Deinococcota bacterium]